MVRLAAAAAALLLAPAAAVAAPAVEIASAEEYRIARTSDFTLTARDGRVYRILVSWPEGAAPPEGWPVLYVLDGEDNFAVVTQTLRRLGRAGARSGVTEGVVVAIESGSLARRVLDYTPAAPGWTIPAGVPASGLATGGADRFLDFIEHELEPAVARRRPIDPQRRALLGHSFGGLLGLHAYFTRPSMFAEVAAVSPSLWFGGDLIAREEATARKTAAPRGRLLVAVGGAERDPVGGGDAAAPAEALVARLNLSSPRARAGYLSLPGQAHGATMLAALFAALRFTSEREAL